MKTRVLLFFLFSVTVFAVGTLITVLFNTAPATSEVIALFYTSLLLTVFGLVFFLIYGLASLRFQAIPDWRTTTGAFRMSGITAVLTAVILGIQSVSLLNAATLIILVLLAAAAELLLRRKFHTKTT